MNISSDRPGVTYKAAQAILEERGLVRSIKTLKRWVRMGILTVKRVTGQTVILFRDEVEALVEPEDDKDQRLLSAKAGRKRWK